MTKNSDWLALSNVSLAFGGLQVLSEVSFSVARGEVLGLIGPNGAGKSALMNCITGAYKPLPGSQFVLNGGEIGHLPPRRRRGAGVCRTFQHVELVRELTVLENVMLGLVPEFAQGLLSYLAFPTARLAEERRLKARAEEAMEMCGVLAHREKPAGTLPLGVARRVDLARALVGQPKLLLLDEPGSGLTHAERSLIVELIGIAKRQAGLAIIWIDHDVSLVTSTADRAVVMQNGKVVYRAEDLSDPSEREAAIRAYSVLV